MVAFRFGCVVFVERTEGGPSKLAWMVVPALLATWPKDARKVVPSKRHLILLRASSWYFLFGATPNVRTADANYCAAR